MYSVVGGKFCFISFFVKCIQNSLTALRAGFLTGSPWNKSGPPTKGGVETIPLALRVSNRNKSQCGAEELF